MKNVPQINYIVIDVWPEPTEILCGTSVHEYDICHIYYGLQTTEGVTIAALFSKRY